MAAQVEVPEVVEQGLKELNGKKERQWNDEKIEELITLYEERP